MNARSTLLIFLIIIFPVASFGSDAVTIKLKCKGGTQRKYISSSVVKRDGSRTDEISSEINREISESRAFNHLLANVSVAPAYRLRESALVKHNNEITKKRRSIPLDKDCGPNEVMDLKDLFVFGLGSAAAGNNVSVGSRWKRQYVIRADSGQIPLTVAYTLVRIDKSLSGDVAIIDLMVSGVEDVGSSKLRWAGVGREVWSLEQSLPIIKIMEIRRGSSFTDGINLEFSYSESALF
jgi:hypothetical protein